MSFRGRGNRGGGGGFRQNYRGSFNRGGMNPNDRPSPWKSQNERYAKLMYRARTLNNSSMHFYKYQYDQMFVDSTIKKRAAVVFGKLIILKIARSTIIAICPAIICPEILLLIETRRILFDVHLRHLSYALFNCIS